MLGGMTVNPDHPSPIDLAHAAPETIRAALIPADQADFDAEYRAALDEAKATFRLDGVHQVIQQWRQYAIAVHSPGHVQNLAVASRFAAGEDLPTVPVDWAALA